MPLVPSTPPAVQSLADLLFGQGFGTRRECAALIDAGLVTVDGHVIGDPRAEFDVDKLEIEVDGRAWSCRRRALLMLNKPVGFECSAKPRDWPSVLTLLPEPLRTRGVQCVGRLDQDTTGLLLLTDDGTLLHRMTSPKHHVPKVYRATVKHALDDAQLRPTPVRAVTATACSTRVLELVLTEGKYHQVRRMVAAAGNRVEALHRCAVGGLVLPDDLAPGQWRWVDDDTLLLAPSASRSASSPASQR
jgi:16S rRNA pseudouridine516 synthase